MNTLQGKLQTIVDKIISYKINATDINYRQFSEINLKQFVANVYLTRIVTIVNKLQENIDKIEAKSTFEGSDEEIKAIDADLTVIKYLFKRRPADAISIHFDVLTDILQSKNENYTLVDGLNKLCNDIQSNISRTIMITDTKAISQFCSKKYGVIYGVVQKEVVEDYDDARKSLMNLVKTLQKDDDVTDAFELLSSR